jgi:hypothetical protein
LRALPPDLARLWDQLQRWLDAVERGELDHHQAAALGVLIARLLDLCRLARELAEAAELEQRLAALETRLSEGVEQ